MGRSRRRRNERAVNDPGDPAIRRTRGAGRPQITHDKRPTNGTYRSIHTHQFQKFGSAKFTDVENIHWLHLDHVIYTHQFSDPNPISTNYSSFSHRKRAILIARQRYNFVLTDVICVGKMDDELNVFGNVIYII